jgi:hypothetical protein
MLRRTPLRHAMLIAVAALDLILGGCTSDTPAPQRPSITVSGSISGTFTQADCIDTGPGGLEIKLAGKMATITGDLTITNSRLTAVRVRSQGGETQVAAARPMTGDMTFDERRVTLINFRIDDVASARSVTLQGELRCSDPVR